MTAYAYYRQERKEFEKEFCMQLSVKETERVYSKLKRHFKIHQPLYWNRRIGAGKCGWNGITLHPERGNNIAVLAHEVAHAIERKTRKRGGRCHTKRHRRCMLRVLRYCKKKNYWSSLEEGLQLVFEKPLPR